MTQIKAASRPEPPIDRARTLIQETAFEYRARRQKVLAEKPKKNSVNLICQIGAKAIDVYRLASLDGNVVIVGGKDDRGVVCTVFAPVEQIAFIIEQIVSNKEPRELKLEAEMARQKEQII